MAKEGQGGWEAYRLNRLIEEGECKEHFQGYEEARN